MVDPPTVADKPSLGAAQTALEFVANLLKN
jgi:hypothetical protein